MSRFRLPSGVTLKQTLLNLSQPLYPLYLVGEHRQFNYFQIVVSVVEKLNIVPLLLGFTCKERRR